MPVEDGCVSGHTKHESESSDNCSDVDQDRGHGGGEQDAYKVLYAYLMQYAEADPSTPEFWEGLQDKGQYRLENGAFDLCETSESSNLVRSRHWFYRDFFGSTQTTIRQIVMRYTRRREM